MSTTIDVTVGKHDSSISYLTTPDFRILEYPSALLPNDIKTGTVLTITMAPNVSVEKEKNESFLNFQNNLLKNLPQFTTKPPVLKVKSKLQTSINLTWDEFELGASCLKSVTLWHKDIVNVDSDENVSIDEDELSQVATLYNTNNTYRMSGLGIESKHAFQLRIDTSNGLFKSDVVTTSTLSVNDFSGFNICVGALSTGNVTVDDINAVADSLGIKNVNRVCNKDTTHFLTDVLDDENEINDKHLLMAKELNIPIVAPHWLQGCAVENKLLGVKGFYYKLSNDDPSNLVAKYPFQKDFTEKFLSNNVQPVLSKEPQEISSKNNDEEISEDKKSSNINTENDMDDGHGSIEETQIKVEDETPESEEEDTSADVVAENQPEERVMETSNQLETVNGEEISQTAIKDNQLKVNNDLTVSPSTEKSTSKSLTPVSTQSKKNKGKKKKNNKKKK
ncbi:uncharacterized protein HGUI_02023 [Hanseniaspora guilliermondii]|uniref:BRCT domain-containing protein n=1 Tax=Hanseniaspora guilliermondii TaxID=56406 RepID=A0A1L0CY54_9ASCO|nr:uncharacterized protein HGUI_02023 [Hanseniaspora guilliermondii]